MSKKSNLDFDYSAFPQYDGITTKSPKKINNLEIFKVNPSIRINQLPPIIYWILVHSVMDGNEKNKFMEKFGMSYLHFPKLRKTVDGWVFLFLDCKYSGIFPTDEDAVAEGHRLNYPGCDIHLSPMYLDIRNEYSETRCVSMGHVVNGLNDLGQKIVRHEHEPYEIDICYSNNDNSVTLQDRGMIDTGCTTTHALWKNYIGFPS